MTFREVYPSGRMLRRIGWRVSVAATALCERKVRMRFARLASAFSFALLGVRLLGAAPVKPPEVTVIRAGTLIDGVSGAPRSNQVIVVRGNRIESVGDAASAKIPQGARVIDLTKATVLPGLIDAHTHIFLQGEDPAEGDYDTQLLKQSPGPPGGPGDRRRAAGARAGLHDDPRRRDRGRRLRRCRHQAGDRKGLHPGSAHVCRHARDLLDRRLSARGLRAGSHRPQGGPARGRPRRGAQGGARAAR